MHFSFFFVFAWVVLGEVCLVYTPDMDPSDVPTAVDCHQSRLYRRDNGKVIQGEGSRVKWTLFCDSNVQTCRKVEHSLPPMAKFLENAV